MKFPIVLLKEYFETVESHSDQNSEGNSSWDMNASAWKDLSKPHHSY